MVDQSRDKNLTLKILIDYFNVQEKPGLHLKALITISKISIQIETLDYNLPVLELITSFYALLMQNEKNHLQFSEFFQTELSRYIQKIEKYTNYYYLIEQEKQKNSLPFSKFSLKIDYHTLIMYDLDIFKNALKTVFANRKEGIFAFNIIKNCDIVKYKQVFEDYLIKRIEKELVFIHLEQKHYHGIERICHHPIEIKLPCSYETVEQTIENKLKDLLETPSLDIIFVVQYESMDRSQLNDTAQNFLNTLKNNYSHYFQNMRYLIIIFASVYFECHLENFIPLPVPKKFEIDLQNIEHCPLTIWFQDTFLKQHKLEHPNQSLYVNRLRDIIRNHQGDLIQTYQSFPNIFKN